MIDRRTVFEIHRLFHDGYGIRKIARTLKLSRDSVKRYLDQPNPPKPEIVPEFRFSFYGGLQLGPCLFDGKL